MVRSQQRQNGRRGSRSQEASDSAHVVQDPLSVAVKRPGDVMRGPAMLDVLQAPLAGKRPGDLRLPHPGEISLDPGDPCHCVMPLNLALWRTLAAVTVGFDCNHLRRVVAS
jgi:hypothetical protein